MPSEAWWEHENCNFTSTCGGCPSKMTMVGTRVPGILMQSEFSGQCFLVGSPGIDDLSRKSPPIKAWINMGISSVKKDGGVNEASSELICPSVKRRSISAPNDPKKAGGGGKNSPVIAL